jgi:hypothetical protein
MSSVLVPDLPRDASIESVVAALRDAGAVRLRELLPTETVTALNREFEILFELEHHVPGRTPISHYRPGTQSRAIELRRLQLHAWLAPALLALFGSSLVVTLTREYLGLGARIADGIYLTHDLPHPTPVTWLHFDRIHALKFFIYLTPTHVTNGALATIPGSRAYGHRQRLDHVRAGVSVRDIPIIQPDTLMDLAVPLDGEAGTMIVFDTDVLHMGGIVRSGTERRILRGHSHAVRNRETMSC